PGRRVATPGGDVPAGGAEVEDDPSTPGNPSVRVNGAPPVAYNGGVELASRCLPLQRATARTRRTSRVRTGADDDALPSQVGPGRGPSPANELTCGSVGSAIPPLLRRRPPGPFNPRRRPTMPTTTLPVVDGGPPAGEAADGRDRRAVAIRAAVLAALGRPGRLYRVAVVPLWGDHFRVNVFTGEDPTSVQIPH